MAPMLVRRWCRRAALIAVLMVGAVVAGIAQAPVTAFVHVNVLPMDRDRLLQDQTVLVRGSRIIAMGPARTVAVPAGAVRVDGTGKYLMPGLGDMHFHQGYGQIPKELWSTNILDSAVSDSAKYRAAVSANEKYLLVKLANGFTTVRDMAGDMNSGLEGGPRAVTLRDRVARGQLLGPRISIGYFVEHDADTTFAEARRIVGAAKAGGYDFVKTHGWAPPPAVFDTFVAALRRAHLRFGGHATAPVERWLAARPLSAEHLYEFFGDESQPSIFRSTISGSDTAGPWTADSELVRQVDAQARGIARAMAQAGVYSCPTLSVAVLYPGKPLPPAGWALLSADVRALRDAGVPMLLGTDALVALRYGPLARDLPITSEAATELAFLARAGLTPYEALATATVNVARYFQAQNSTGTVAVGKRADLVLYDRNPLADVRNATRPAGVMLGGQWFSRAAFDAKFAALGIPADWH